MVVAAAAGAGAAQSFVLAAGAGAAQLEAGFDIAVVVVVFDGVPQSSHVSSSDEVVVAEAGAGAAYRFEKDDIVALSSVAVAAVEL